MTDKFKGVTEIEILGKVRGFRITMLTMIRVCEKLGTDFNGFTEILQKGGMESLKFVYELMHIAACQYSKLKNEDEPSFDEVAVWVDEIGFEKSLEIITISFKQPVDPNPEAPK